MSRLFLCLFFLLPACSKSAPTLEIVEIEFPVGGAPMNEHFSFIVDLGDAQLLHANADMPSHGHGINTQPEWRQLPDGRWQVEGMLLHMPGYWELYFDVRNTDGSTQSLIFPLTLEH